jgi:hypothetical protein
MVVEEKRDPGIPRHSHALFGDWDDAACHRLGVATDVVSAKSDRVWH